MKMASRDGNQPATSRFSERKIQLAEIKLTGEAFFRSLFNRRVAFRVVFSAVEGTIFLLRDQLLAGLDPNSHTYSTAEIALLREETYQLDNRGNAVPRKRFLRVAENLLFTWNMYFRDVLPDFNPNLDGNGWNAFQDALAIRNRITHPRSDFDSSLSDQDMRCLVTAFKWVHSTTFRNIAAAVLHTRREHYKLWNQLLSPKSLAWLDRLYTSDKTAFDATGDRISAFSMKDIAIPRDILSELIRWRLATCGDDDVCLDALGVLYVTWRSKEIPIADSSAP